MLNWKLRSKGRRTSEDAADAKLDHNEASTTTPRSAAAAVPLAASPHHVSKKMSGDAGMEVEDDEEDQEIVPKSPRRFGFGAAVVRKTSTGSRSSGSSDDSQSLQELMLTEDSSNNLGNSSDGGVEDAWWDSMLKMFGGSSSNGNSSATEEKTVKGPEQKKPDTFENFIDLVDQMAPGNYQVQKMLEVKKLTLEADKCMAWRYPAAFVRVYTQELLRDEDSMKGKCTCTATQVGKDCKYWLAKAHYLIKDCSKPFVEGVLQNSDLELKVWCLRFVIVAGYLASKGARTKCRGPVPGTTQTVEQAVSNEEEKNANADEPSEAKPLWKNLSDGEDVHLREFSPASPFYTLAIFAIMIKLGASKENPIPEIVFQLLFEALTEQPMPMIPADSVDPCIEKDIPLDSKIVYSSIFRLIAHLVDGTVSRQTYEAVMKRSILLLDPSCKNPHAEENATTLLLQKDWNQWLTPILLREAATSSNSSLEALSSKFVQVQISSLLQFVKPSDGKSSSGEFHHRHLHEEEEKFVNSKLELHLLSLPMSLSIFHEKSTKKFVDSYVSVTKKLSKQGKFSIYAMLNVIIKKTEACIVEKWRNATTPNLKKSFIRNLELFIKQTLCVAFFSSGFSHITLDFVHDPEDPSRLLPAGLTLVNSLLSLFQSLESKIIEPFHDSKSKKVADLAELVTKLQPLLEEMEIVLCKLANIGTDEKLHTENAKPKGILRRKHSASAVNGHGKVEELVESAGKKLHKFIKHNTNSSAKDSKAVKKAVPTTEAYASQLRDYFAYVLKNSQRKPQEEYMSLLRMTQYFEAQG